MNEMPTTATSPPHLQNEVKHLQKRAISQRTLGGLKKVEHKSDFFITPCFELAVDGKAIRYVESNRQSYKRIISIFEKEPTTIPWLESFQPNETFVDIGANIGLYSIYASAMTGCRTFSFEPESLNYAELNKNIFVNGLNSRISAFCLALSDEEKVDYLYLGAFGPGYAFHDFGENTWEKDKQWGEKFTRKDARLQQGCVSSTLDQLVRNGVMPVPDHIKVDVDGIEHRVFAGMQETIKDPRVKSILFEVVHTIEKSAQIVEQMKKLGWKLSLDQVRTNRKSILTPAQVENALAERKFGFNYIFFRDDRYFEFFTEYLSTFNPPWAYKIPGAKPKTSAIAAARVGPFRFVTIFARRVVKRTQILSQIVVRRIREDGPRWVIRDIVRRTRSLIERLGGVARNLRQ